MIRRRLANLLARSRNRDLIEFLLAFLGDIVASTLRFSARDEKALVSYLDWLQEYRISHGIELDEEPHALLLWLESRWKEAGQLKAKLRLLIAAASPAWLKALYRGARRAIRLVFELARLPFRLARWLWRRLSGLLRRARHRLLALALVPIALLKSLVRVHHLYAFSRKAAYDLLVKHGDLEGAMAAFQQLSRLRSRPDSKVARRDRLMVNLLPRIVEVERRYAQTRFPEGGAERPLVISLAVWGERYLRLLEDYCLPSLLAPGNLPAIAGDARIHWHIFTTPAGMKRLWSGPFCERLWRMSSFKFEEIADELTALAVGDDRYWLYGGLTNTSFRYAARLGADIHFLNPDTVYSKDYFASLYGLTRRSGARIVLAKSFRTALETMGPALDCLMTNGRVIELDAGELHTIGLRHIHPSSAAHFIDAAEASARGVPRSALAMWRDQDRIIVHAAHHAPIFVDRQALSPDMRLPYFTVDSAILRNLAGSEDLESQVHLVGPEDRIGYVEMSPRRAFPVDRVSLDRFAEIFWRSNTAVELELFRRALELPLDTRLGAGPPGARDAAASADAFAEMVRAVEGARPRSVRPARTKWHSMADLAIRADEAFRFEVRHGCGPACEARVEEIRGIVRNGRTLFTREQAELDHLGPLMIAFLRLGLLDELVGLRDRHALPLEATAASFIAYCAGAYPTSAARGAAYRARFPAGELFVIGSIVWGEEYVRNFLDFNLRSMLAEGNLPAMRKEGRVVHAIVTDLEGELAIRRHPAFAQALPFVDFEFMTVPETLLRALTASHLSSLFYLFYGMLDHCSVHFAQGMGAHLFLIPVDAVVADGSLASLAAGRRAGYECCGGGNVVAESETFLPELRARFEGKDAIAISTPELATLAVKHAHHYFRSQVVALENADFGRHPRELFWPVPGGLEIHSVFIHPLFTTAAALQRYKRMHYANLDYGMIPRIMPDARRIRVVEDASEAYINNFASGARRYETTGRPFAHDDFLKAHEFSYPVQKSLFPRAQRLPCDYSGWTPYRTAATDVAQIWERLRPYDPAAERAAS